MLSVTINQQIFTRDCLIKRSEQCLVYYLSALVSKLLLLKYCIQIRYRRIIRISVWRHLERLMAGLWKIFVPCYSIRQSAMAWAIPPLTNLWKYSHSWSTGKDARKTVEKERNSLPAHAQFKDCSRFQRKRIIKSFTSALRSVPSGRKTKTCLSARFADIFCAETITSFRRRTSAIYAKRNGTLKLWRKTAITLQLPLYTGSSVTFWPNTVAGWAIRQNINL